MWVWPAPSQSLGALTLGRRGWLPRNDGRDALDQLLARRCGKNPADPVLRFVHLHLIDGLLVV